MELLQLQHIIYRYFSSVEHNVWEIRNTKYYKYIGTDYKWLGK